MGGKPRPKPSILDRCTIDGIEGGRKVYKDEREEVFYTWDSWHGELEVFNKNGRHIGVADPLTGVLIKPPVRGRRISKRN
ncbi:colicin E3/pyocin S6 family cytotoxin [Achromobacter xylosoxidans]|uniref:colicin E3/pyocin S6 family cytotoxin n=1 Tax=Alcaligenes xylosoxydans xylosoxydans TaxID=85698 RepID=UPI000D1BAC87